MGILKFKYKLTTEELEEVLLCLNWKKEGKMRDINLCIISILGAFVLYLYIRNPGQFFMAVLLLVIILLLFYIAYWPAAARKKKIRKMMKEDGEYRIELTESGITYGSDNRRLKWSGNKIKCLNSENMMLIKMEREVFAIPKRILTKEQQTKLGKVLEQQKCERISIEIKKRSD